MNIRPCNRTPKQLMFNAGIMYSNASSGAQKFCSVACQLGILSTVSTYSYNDSSAGCLQSSLHSSQMVFHAMPSCCQCPNFKDFTMSTVCLLFPASASTTPLQIIVRGAKRGRPAHKCLHPIGPVHAYHFMQHIHSLQHTPL